MAKFTKENVNTIFARMPDIKRIFSSFLRKQIAFCPLRLSEEP